MSYCTFLAAEAAQMTGMSPLLSLCCLRCLITSCCQRVCSRKAESSGKTPLRI